MALINCSECNKKISDKSPHCIGCGAPSEVMLSNNKKDKVQLTKKKKEIILMMEIWNIMNLIKVELK